MKTLLALTAFALAAGSAAAQTGPREMGRVINTTPVVQQVAVPQQYCGTQPVVTQAPPSGAGAVLGAVAGGVLGNAIGHGSGRAAATALGVFGGAVMGNQVEANGSTRVQNVQNCVTQTNYENRTVGYDVTYEYAGRQYTTRMASDPGQWVPVQVGAVSPDSYQAPQPVASAPGNSLQPAYVEPGVVVSSPRYYAAPPVVYSPPVVYAPPAYPAYYGAPAVAPIGLSLNLGYSRGWGGGYHHWR
ncbi:glycine zipper 2TM domain-containing protein [Xylophilus sp. ASV27]|uniref:glycine zipper 2TM domain-containing protein n=1 Tax=Xylophilus sp. ASV27 TaxID=2795129 RepID=UPI0018EE1A14|nr:glycine zipper 2TM domain-containing protein [Xylophilus sp. ASV27]